MFGARLHTTSSLVDARLIESRLREAGLPVSVRIGGTGVSWLQPAGPFEVWIADESLLQTPEAQAALRAAFGANPFTPEVEDEIASMPFHDEPSEFGLGLVLILFVIGLALLIAAYIWLPRIWPF